MNLPQQVFDVSLNNKSLFGEVTTDFQTIYQMIHIIPKDYFKNPDLRILDPTCGRGYFAMVLFQILLKELTQIIPNKKKRKDHIIQNMIYMVEINPEHIPTLRRFFGEKANIYNEDFLSFTSDKFDLIIGNPPYNAKGMKKVPTNIYANKKYDGKTVWSKFVKHSISLLKEDGYLNMIIPSIWMKPDKERMYDYMMQFYIHKIRCFSNTETNKMFHGRAQTPTCFFLLQNTETKHNISLFDPIQNKYILWKIEQNIPIPLLGISILNKLRKYVKQYGPIKVIKTNMPPKGTFLSDKQSNITPYPNIKTCILKDNKPFLVENYSNRKLAFFEKPKIILAHKMYGCPFIDYYGKYGISNRDNYVIINRSRKDFIILKEFLSTSFCRYLFEATRYRMKYLEKYIFQLLPDITYISDFPVTITDSTIMDYFQLDDKERNIILSKRKLEK